MAAPMPAPAPAPAAPGGMLASRFPPAPPPLGTGHRPGPRQGGAAPAVHLQYLTSIRNAVIGSRTKKAALAQHGDISYFVTLLGTSAGEEHGLDIRSQAATILGSIAHGASTKTLLVLLRAYTAQHLVRALGDLLTARSTQRTTAGAGPARDSLLLTASTSTPLKTLESTVRALRALMLTIADELHASPRWGVGSGWGTKGAAPTPSAVPAGARLHSSVSSLAWSDAHPSAAPSSTEIDEDERQVRILGRQAIAYCFHDANLPLLLAPLMLVPTASHDSMSGSGLLLPPPASSAAGPPATAGTANLFPSSTRVRLNNITEMIFFLLSACLAIPGPGPSGLASLDPALSGTAASIPSSPTPTPTHASPEAELYHRRISMLTFTAARSPWNHVPPTTTTTTAVGSASAGDPDAVPSDEWLATSSSRRPAQAQSQHDPDPAQQQQSRRTMQAELLHSPSRSGSLDRERDRRRHQQGQDQLQPQQQQPLHHHLDPALSHDARRGSVPAAGRNDGGQAAGGGGVGGSLSGGGGASSAGPMLASREPETGLLDVLVEAVQGSLSKTREAALWTIGELLRDCPSAAHRFILCPTETGEQTTTMLLRFREDPDVDIRLAAFCCMANIVKVHNFGANTSEYVLAALMELLDPTAAPMSISSGLSGGSSSSTNPGAAASASSAGPRFGSLPASGASRSTFDSVRNQLLGASSTARLAAAASASASSSASHQPHHHQASSSQSAAAILPPLLVTLGTPREIDVQMQACFALARLLSDHVDLQYVSHERFGLVRRAAALVDASWKEVKKRLLAAAAASASAAECGNGDDPGGMLGAGNGSAAPMLVAGSGGRLLQNAAPLPALSEGVVRLLEASLTVLATVAFHADEIRQTIIEMPTPSLLPTITACLSVPAPGIRIAACRLIRALSRSVAALRTSLVDAGVGQKLIALLHSEAEPHEVRLEVVAALSNMVLKHSPMHELVLQSRGVERLVSFLDERPARTRDDAGAGGGGGGDNNNNNNNNSRAWQATDGSMVINVLWALRNLLARATWDVKRAVGAAVGWERLLSYAGDADAPVQEQALSVVRNLVAALDAGDMELAAEALGLDRLLDLLENVIWTRRGVASGGSAGGGGLAAAGAGAGALRPDWERERGDALVLVQAANVLLNLATGNRAMRMALLDRPNLLDAILFFLHHPNEEIRVAGIWCASNLTYQLEPVYGHGGVSQNHDDVGAEAVKRLRSFNFHTHVRELLDREASLNVRDRAKVLLSALEVPVRDGR